MGHRVRVVEVFASHQFEAHHYRGDDGFPTAAVFSPVVARAADGREFFLPQGRLVRDEEGFVGYVARYDAAAMRDRVEAVGSIDPACWVEVEPYDLEEELAAEAEREAMERAGYA